MWGDMSLIMSLPCMRTDLHRPWDKCGGSRRSRHPVGCRMVPRVETRGVPQPTGAVRGHPSSAGGRCGMQVGVAWGAAQGRAGQTYHLADAPVAATPAGPRPRRSHSAGGAPPAGSSSLSGEACQLLARLVRKGLCTSPPCRIPLGRSCDEGEVFTRQGMRMELRRAPA